MRIPAPLPDFATHGAALAHVARGVCAANAAVTPQADVAQAMAMASAQSSGHGDGEPAWLRWGGRICQALGGADGLAGTGAPQVVMHGLHTQAAAWRFRDLYLALCDAAGQPAQPGPPDTGAFSFSLHFHEVEVVMAHLPRLRPHAALVGVPLGRREPGEQAQAEALAMMEANFALAGQPHGAAFSRDPASGELLLRYAYPLDGACGHHCLAQMNSLAAFAREWVASLIPPRTATPHPAPAHA